MTVFTKHTALQKQLTIQLWHTASTTYGLISQTYQSRSPARAWKRFGVVFTSYWSVLFSAPLSDKSRLFGTEKLVLSWTLWANIKPPTPPLLVLNAVAFPVYVLYKWLNICSVTAQNLLYVIALILPLQRLPLGWQSLRNWDALEPLVKTWASCGQDNVLISWHWFFRTDQSTEDLLENESCLTKTRKCIIFIGKKWYL